uniref:Aspartyl-tRNA synthetase n=1 Tax=Fusarium oxysporum (strain Fo5176) TaxID=660025 RepID=A0A0D2XGQ0_FUSOF
MADAPAEQAAAPPPAEQAPAVSGEAVEGGEAGPSKKALKKAEAKAKKEAEKARRAAEHEARQSAAKAAAGNTEDLAKDNYGDSTHLTKIDAERVKLRNLSDEHLGKTIKLRAWIQNARMQGAKMAFVELREERDWAIQGVVAASSEGTPVSKQMVKWIGSLNLEGYILVEAKVVKPQEPVKSVKVSNYELHISKCYVISPGPQVLGMGLAVANRPVTNFDDEDAGGPVEEVKEGVDNLSLENVPGASMATHLNNPVMHKRAPVQQAIADVRLAVRKLFVEYLEARDFVQLRRLHH